MKYFLDTEFHEYKKKLLFSKEIDTIDLISIGIVSEDGREYYAVSKDFDLKAAWDNKWLRDNVLKPMYEECTYINERFPANKYPSLWSPFSLESFERFLKTHGKSNYQIKNDIVEFCNNDYKDVNNNYFRYTNAPGKSDGWIHVDPEFYGYYADYDWVVFCWLFGRMIDLPTGFPMYCKDLKQMLDEKAESLTSSELSKLSHTDIVKHNVYETYDTGVLKCSKTDLLKNALIYPKQSDEHNALSDAKWNLELYKLLNNVL